MILRRCKILIALLAVPILCAHHSFMSEFDHSAPVTLEGVVTNVEWANPHTYFSIDVKGTRGGVINWMLEGGSPSAMYSRGWTRTTLKLGQTVKVKGYRAKNKSAHLAAARSVSFEDGRLLLSGEMDDGGPPN
jgi:hypothetical protein